MRKRDCGKCPYQDECSVRHVSYNVRLNMFLHIFEAKIEHERKKTMPKIDQFPGPVEEYLVTNKKTEEEKRNTADFPCEGHWSHTVDGDDFDCEYEFAGEITCDECKINGGPYDPRFPREPDDEL